jgi:hypothetical protein
VIYGFEVGHELIQSRAISHQPSAARQRASVLRYSPFQLMADSSVR